MFFLECCGVFALHFSRTSQSISEDTVQGFLSLLYSESLSFHRYSEPLLIRPIFRIQARRLNPLGHGFPKTFITALFWFSRLVDVFTLKPGKNRSLILFSLCVSVTPVHLLSISLLEVKRGRTRGCGTDSREMEARAPEECVIVWMCVNASVFCSHLSVMCVSAWKNNVRSSCPVL